MTAQEAEIRELRRELKEAEEDREISKKALGYLPAGRLLEAREVKYQFVELHRRRYRVGQMCRLLSVSRSGYYAWVRNPRSHRRMENDRLEFEIRHVFAVGRGEYGSPTICEALSQEGFAVNRNRIAHLTRQMGLSWEVAKRCMDRDASPPGAWQCKEPKSPGIGVSRELA